MNPIRELTSNEIDHVSGGPAPVVVVVVVRVAVTAATSTAGKEIAKNLGAAAVGAATAIITEKILDSGGDD